MCHEFSNNYSEQNLHDLAALFYRNQKKNKINRWNRKLCNVKFNFKTITLPARTDV